MLLEIIRSLGLRSLEIPTHPRDGLSIDALDFAKRVSGVIQACVVTPNFQNPPGSLKPLEAKRRLVALGTERGFTLTESDFDGETHCGDEPSPVQKGFDAADDVMLCSSFTKAVAPGCRLTRPHGGFMLWIELPKQVDTRRVFERARREHIGPAPGSTVSRIHNGEPWSARLEAHLRRLGELVAALALAG